MFATALEKIADMCFASAFETYFEVLLFLVRTQNKGSAFSKFTVKSIPLLRQLLEAGSFNLVEYFRPPKSNILKILMWDWFIHAL